MTHGPKSTQPVLRYPAMRVNAISLELWRGERCLFDDLSFSMSSPVLHIRGENGSGKTTLLKVLSGITDIEQGQIQWTLNSKNQKPAEIAGQLAFAGHQHAVNPGLSVRENLLWGVGLYRAVDQSEIEQAAEQHQLQALLPRLGNQLSAGQKRRVALLRSVLSQLPVWVWDEPYANLDQAGIQWVNQLIDQHVAQGGSVLLSAHQAPSLATGVVQNLELNA